MDGAAVCAAMAETMATGDGTRAGALSGERELFSAQESALRARLREMAREEGMGVREDAAGNLFFRLEGEDASLPAVATGSRIEAGVACGAMGAWCGMEALRAIARSGERPLRAIELVVPLGPEAERFGWGCLGSRLLSGAMDGETAEALTDGDGRTLRELRLGGGHADGEMCGVRLQPGHWSAWVEMQAEVGRRGEELGVATGVAARASLRFALKGEGGDAGALRMPARRDALCAAAELVLQVEYAARRSGSTETVATVGRMVVTPNAEDLVPERVELTVDVRDVDTERRDRALRQIRAAAQRVVADRGVGLEEYGVSEDDAAACAPALVEVVERCATERAVRIRREVSRGEHDAQFLARVAPAVVVLVPWGDVAGRAKAVERGTAVLAETLLELAGAGQAIRGDL